MMNSRQIKLTDVISNMRKEITKLHGLRNVEEVGENQENMLLMLGNDQTYHFSSICRFPFYQIDFGWGKPLQVMVQTTAVDKIFIVLMDSPFEDGIEAIVHLEKEDMTIFQKDKELLAYVKDD
ncbi:acylsugar acyltransferase 3-like protein [Tanacetum coccineum]